jgi:hypothetical protein
MQTIYPQLSEKAKKPPCQMARTGLYRPHDTARLPGQHIAARPDRAGTGGSAAHRLAWRVNELVPLGDGMSCAAIAKVMLPDDATIRTWHRLYQENGIERPASFGYEGGACRDCLETGQTRCRVKLRNIPAYCPHLEPIERLWGLEVPRNRHIYYDAASNTTLCSSSPPRDIRILT